MKPTAPALSTRRALSVEEASAQLGVSQAFVYRLVAEGTIRATRLGRRVLIPVEGIDELLQSAEPVAG